MSARIVVLDGFTADQGEPDGWAALAALPALRYLGVCATGTNIVDLAVARTHGVAVTNVPGYAAESVAQLVLALVLHLALDVGGHDRAVKAGRWAATPDFCFFLRPGGIPGRPAAESGGLDVREQIFGVRV
jgi:glycerate dehydrogenase